MEEHIQGGWLMMRQQWETPEEASSLWEHTLLHGKDEEDEEEAYQDDDSYLVENETYVEEEDPDSFEEEPDAYGFRPSRW